MVKQTVKKAAKKSAAKKTVKYIYSFGAGKAEGNGSMKELLGGKGANLAEMSGTLKLPVPPGFTITTEVCTYYWNNSEFSQYLQGPKKHVFTLSLRGCPYAKAFANAIDQAFLEEEIATAYQKDIVPIGRSEYLNCNGKQCPRMYLFNTCGQGLCIINPAKRQIVVEKSRSKERLMYLLAAYKDW